MGERSSGLIRAADIARALAEATAGYGAESRRNGDRLEADTLVRVAAAYTTLAAIFEREAQEEITDPFRLVGDSWRRK